MYLPICIYINHHYYRQALCINTLYHTFIHKYIHTCIHTCIHTYIYIGNQLISSIYIYIHIYDQLINYIYIYTVCVFYRHTHRVCIYTFSEWCLTTVRAYPRMIRQLQGSLESSQEVFTSQGWYTLCALAVGQHQRTTWPNQNAALQWFFIDPWLALLCLSQQFSSCFHYLFFVFRPGHWSWATEFQK